MSAEIHIRKPYVAAAGRRPRTVFVLSGRGQRQAATPPGPVLTLAQLRLLTRLASTDATADPWSIASSTEGGSADAGGWPGFRSGLLSTNRIGDYPPSALHEGAHVPHPQSKRAKAAKRQRAEQRRERTADDQAERARRQSASEERRDGVRVKRRRRARAWTVAVWATVLFVVGGVGYALWNQSRPGPELAGVERPSYEGRGHITGATYASSTPTSGAHDSRSPACVVYPTPLDPALAVHALEHGAVVLWYDAANPELAGDLAVIARGWDSHVIVSPAPGLADPVVATAWNRRKAYPGVVAEVEEFVDTYRKRGPEDVDCDQA